jgi:hypothetical protein
MAGRFLAALVVELYIFSRVSGLEHVFRNNTDLGVHTGVIMYGQDGVIWEYIWTHVKAAPYGIQPPLSCGKCCALYPWGEPVALKSPYISRLMFKCQTAGCPKEERYTIPRLFRVTRHFEGDSAGEWFGRYLSDEPNATRGLKLAFSDGKLIGTVPDKDK